MSTQSPIVPDGNASQPGPASILVPIAAQGTASLPASALPSRRVGAELDTHWRVVAGVLGTLVLAYGCVLAWRVESDGIAVASAFAVGLVTLIFALAGVVPASVKVGDVEVQLKQAKAEGKVEGKQEGAVAGLQAAAAICEKVKEGVIQPDEVESALAEALSSDAALDLPAVTGPPLPVANLGDEEAATAASSMAQAFSPGT